MTVITADTILGLLKAKHSDDLFVPECRVGFGPFIVDGRIDAWAMKKSWAKPLTVGYEIKVNRSDFIHDNKWQIYLPYCNEFYFCSPRDVIDPKEVPDSCGLIYVSSTGSRLFTKVKAQWKGIPDGTLEPLYKALLMSRVRIKSRFVEHQSSGQATLRFVESFIAEKEHNRRYGRNLSKRYAEIYKDKIKAVADENQKLQREVENLELFKTMMQDIGVDPGDYRSAQKAKRAVMGEDVANMVVVLRDAKRQLSEIITKMEAGCPK